MPLCGLALGAALLVAMITDLRWRIIPNWLNLGIALTAPLAWYAQGLSLWPDIAIQLAVAAGVFLPFVILFAIGAMGGGDVKLLAAMALWITPALVMPFLLVMAVLGGIIAGAMLVHLRARRSDPAHAENPQQTNVSQLNGQGSTADDATTEAPEVPYGVAIGLAGWWVVHQQYLNHFLSHALN